MIPWPSCLISNHLSRIVSRAAIAAVVLTVVAASADSPSSKSHSSGSVAVLWFTNKGAEQDWMRTGLTEILITAFSRIPSVKVVERTRLDALEKELHLSQLQQAEAMGKLVMLERVDHVIVGSFETKGEKLEINAALVDANSGQVASTASVVGMVAHFGKLAEQLARQLLRKKVNGITEEELSKLRLVPSYDFSALQWHSRGRDRFAEGTYADALEAFWLATKRDPNFVQALEALGQTYEVVGEPGHALLTYESALAVVQEAGDAIRISYQVRQLVDKSGNEELRKQVNDYAPQKELEVLRRTLPKDPIASMPREEMWKRYRDPWTRALEEMGKVYDNGSAYAIEYRYQQELSRECATVRWISRYVALLARFDPSEEAFVWWDRLMHLRRFCLTKTWPHPLVKHGFRWLSTARPASSAPDWVVPLDSADPTWSFPADALARDRFRIQWFGDNDSPQRFFIQFLTPPGYYFLKGTVEAVTEEPPAGHLEDLPLLRPLDARKEFDLATDPRIFLEGYLRLQQAWEQARSSIPAKEWGKSEKMAELGKQEAEIRWTRSPSRTSVSPPGTTGMCIMLPVRDQMWFSTTKSNYAGYVRVHGWKFSFVLTRSPTESELPEVAEKPQTKWDESQIQSYGCCIRVDEPETEVRINGEVVKDRWGLGKQATLRTDVKSRFDLRSPTGQTKSFSFAGHYCGEMRLSTHNGWRPMGEGGGGGSIMLDRTGLFWSASAFREKGRYETDIRLCTSRDLETWSDPMPVPLNTPYNEYDPQLVQQPDGTLRMFWYCDRPTPTQSQTGYWTWTATSKDGQRWSEPTIMPADSGIFLREQSVFNTAVGFGWLKKNGQEVHVWRSGEEPQWHSQYPYILGRSAYEEDCHLIAVTPNMDGTLWGLWWTRDKSRSDQPMVSLAAGTSKDAVSWELTETLFRAPRSVLDRGAASRSYRPLWRCRLGWIMHCNYRSSETNQRGDGFVLFPAQGDARILPGIWLPYADRPTRCLVAGDKLIARWGRQIWTCPVDEIVDCPIDKLPRCTPEGLQ